MDVRTVQGLNRHDLLKAHDMADKRINSRLIIHLLVLQLFILASSAHAQRYHTQIFDEMKRWTVTYDTIKSLQMDVYSATADDLKNRPLVLFVHGGGFAGGARDEPEIVDFCKNMARRGIVAVSMSYTLTMKGQSFSCDQPSENKLSTFKQVAEEIHSAAIYLIRNNSELRINPEHIVLAGSSAGAEAVLHAAYWSETLHQLPKDFSYAGVISMAGAISNIDWINAKSALPMQFFHGTCDDLVPYGKAPHHYCNTSDVGYLMLYGAGAIVEKLKNLNQGYYLITGCNDNHSWAGKPFKSYQAEIADFIYHDVLQNKLRQIHHIIPTEKECAIVDAPSSCETEKK